MPEWASPITLDDMRTLVREAHRLMPDVGIQIPPNLSDWWLPLVEEGRDRPRRAVRERRSHLARAPVPVAAQDAQAAPAEGLRADRAAVRVPAVHGRRVARAGRARRDQAEVLELHPAARVGPAVGPLDPARPGRAGDREGARRADRLDRGGAHRDVRRDAARGDRGHAPGGRRAAARGRGRRGDVRRQPQHQRLEHLRRRLRVLRLRAGQAVAGRLRARARRSSSAACEEAVEFGATEICMQSGIHPDWTIEDYESWLRLAKRGGAGDPPARVLADGGGPPRRATCRSTRRSRG